MWQTKDGDSFLYLFEDQDLKLEEQKTLLMKKGEEVVDGEEDSL
jgi:hypothetical protein